MSVYDRQHSEKRDSAGAGGCLRVAVIMIAFPRLTLSFSATFIVRIIFSILPPPFPGPFPLSILRELVCVQNTYFQSPCRLRSARLPSRTATRLNPLPNERASPFQRPPQPRAPSDCLCPNCHLAQPKPRPQKLPPNRLLPKKPPTLRRNAVAHLCKAQRPQKVWLFAIVHSRFCDRECDRN